MPLFELEDGPTRRFYRIELDGTRVGLNWGRIGYDGTHESLRFETAAEARIEYERQIARRRERGYREVERLAPNVIEDGDKKPVLEREATRDLDPAMVAARDRELAELVERGLRLEQLGDDHGARPRAPSLQANLALEAAVAEDPFDGSAWMVLEDWLLEVDDPRAAIVRAEQIGRARKHARRADITAAYERLGTQLLGQRHAAITRALEEPTWRAGYLLAARFNPKVHHGELFAHLLASPATPLLRSLELCVLENRDLAAMLEQLGNARCAAALRELVITSLLPIAAQLDGTMLAPMRLDRLAIKNLPLDVGYAPVLAQLRRLELLTHVGYELLQHSFAELRTLVLDVDALEKSRWNSDECAIRLSELAPLLEGTCAPKLENLHVANARPPTIRALVVALADSKLVSQLRTLDLGGERVDGASLGAAFAHLELVRLPA